MSIPMEQAIYTSVRTDRCMGYQVAATSPGVDAADRRALTIWGPSHGSLAEAGTAGHSFNFFPLPSGSFCISRTSPAGCEYSGRGGALVYTHCLIVPAENLLPFANHPLALARAAASAGAFDTRTEIPAILEPFELAGTGPVVRQGSLVQLVKQVGAWQVALLVQTVLGTGGTVAVSSSAPAEQLIAGLLDCLPVQCRTAVSFSTGLSYSSRRKFHVISLPHDRSARRRLAHRSDVTVLDLATQKPCHDMPVDHWALFIERVLSEAQIGFLVKELSQPRTDMTLHHLPSLGLHLLKHLGLSL